MIKEAIQANTFRNIYPSKYGFYFSVKEADIPHVMISYNWSAQQTMMKVRNRLKAAGYKVWMDIDNMSVCLC